MTPTELGKLFLEHYPVDENGFSPVAYMDDLELIEPTFRTKNGCQWARTGSSWLGKQFKIERIKKGNRIFSVQMIGFQDKQENRYIPQAVRNNISKQCVVLATSVSIEIDHKNARYDNPTQNLEDFQPLHKTVNDAKRQHCKVCLSTKTRFDAKVLGSHISFTKGDKDSSFCEGCYWHDPYDFWQKTTKLEK